MTQSRNGWHWKLGLASALAVGGALAELSVGIIATSGDRAFAQLNLTPDTAPDRNLGTAVVPVTPQVDLITGGTRPQNGSNLFHSFAEFNVLAARGVYFENPAGITNILSRVTGNDPSDILGTLGVVGNANLFLMNPNGIVFGPNASLDVGGSFVATTANAIQLGNAGLFSASEPTTSNLLAVNPSALFFNALANQAEIVNRSTATRADAALKTPTGEGFFLNGPPDRSINGLQVLDSQSLSLVGGDVSLDGGRLIALGGRVELGGVAGSGTVGLSVDGSNLSLSFPDTVARANMSLTNGAAVNVTAGGGGSIAVNAQNLSILGESALLAGIGQDLGAPGAQAGNIEINAAGKITLAGDASLIENLVQDGAEGNGGNITIKTGALSVTSGAGLSTSTFGQGNAGNLTIDARNKVSFDGVGSEPSGAISRVESGAAGQAGDITITTGSLSVKNGARLAAPTQGHGNAGDVTINAGSVSLDGVFVSSEGRRSPSRITTDVGGPDQPNAVGKGGNITIKTDSLSVTDGATLAANTFANGDAGNVTILARDSVSFKGGNANSRVQEQEEAMGNAGTITIKAGSLSVTEGAQLNTTTNGDGAAGGVTINVRNSVSFDGVGSGGGSSGAFSLVGGSPEDKNRIDMMGNGGRISITARSLSVTNGARLVTSTNGQGNAGSVTINARKDVSFAGVGSNGRSSGVNAQVGSDARGNGGNINIKTGSLSVTEGARLSTTTNGRQGNAGNITINARDSVSLAGSKGDGGGIFSRVDSAARGNGGNINIKTGSLSVTEGARLSTNNEGTSGTGLAGNLNVVARSILLDKGSISSETTSGQGNIILDSQDLVLRRGSRITTNATGTANGGNITINTGVLAALENSDISADAEAASGGQVIINAQGDFRSPDSDITASSNLGPQFSGTVEINTPDVELQSSLTPPSLANFVSPEQIVAGSCLARRNVEQGSFTVTGTGGLPRSPYEAISGQFTVAGVQPIQGSGSVSSRAAVGESAPWKRGDPIQEAQGMVVTADGRTLVGTTPQLVALARAQSLVCHVD